MYSKIIFVLATACVINASVLTVNIFDDDPENETNPKDCNFRACDQLCRRLKFPGGACVNGRCKCDILLNAEDEVSEETVSNLEDLVLQKDDPETEVAAKSNKCNLTACDLVCRWLKKTSGSCVDGRCKCAKSLVTGDEAEVATSLKKCTSRACYSQCRSGNYISGACVNGRCKCSNSTNIKGDPESEVENKKSNCNNQACDQLCRRLKFSGGACVNGRCKCDNFLSAKDAVSESNIEDSAPSRACNNKRCNQLCRKQKFRGGACLGANCNCYCNKFISLLEDTMTGLAESLPLSSCNSVACDYQCRRTGWHSGVCINGQCKCDYFLNTEVSENSVSNLEDSVSPRKCTHQECNMLCRRLKFREGVCIAGRCSCNNYFPTLKDTMNDLEKSISLESLDVDDNVLSTEDKVSDESFPVIELSEDQTERGCNARVCEQICRRLKYPGGACVNGRCKCDNSFGTEDAVDEYTELAPRRICRLTKCNRKCTRRGYEGATCVNGRCKCYNNLQEKDDISETSLPVSELTEDQPERDCNMWACDQLCRRLEFPGGTCVNGRCKCDIFFGTEDAVEESATKRVCQLRQCNRTCTRRGFEGSRCVNGWCKCHNKIQSQDASPLNDVINDENEESHVVLRTNEEELTVPSPSACNTVTCNQMCHRLNYAGGWCRLGQCQCY